MAVFKIAKCRCGYSKNVPKPVKTQGGCPKCGAELYCLDNWYVSYTVQGRKYVQAVGPNKREAEDALAKVRVEIREKRFFDKTPETSWGKAADSFRQWFVTNCKPKTALMYENSIKVLTPFFEKHTLNKITPQMVEAFKAERSTQVTNSTLNRDLATIKRLFSLAEEWGMVEVNRILKVKKLQENPARTRNLTEEEVSRLITSCGPGWLKLAVTLAVDTGMRKTPIFTLRRQEIDFDKNIIEKESKGGKTIRVPMTDRVRTALQNYIREQKVIPQGGYIFPSRDNPSRPVRIDSDTSFKRACRVAGIKDLRFHDLRHTFATLFYQRTKDWKALQDILGHSDISITMKVYTHLKEDHLQEAMERFERKGAMK